MSEAILDQFKNHQYINVETFRKSGVGVKTPVWFVRDGDALYVRTEEDSGKMKRMRNFSNIRVAPCDARGGLLGDWYDAQGEIVRDEAENKRVDRLVTKKYGLFKRFFDLLGLFRKSTYASFVIRFS